MTSPNEFRLFLICMYLALALFGIGYNKLIAWAEEHPWFTGLTSLAVVLGNAVTVLVTFVPVWSLPFPGWVDLVLLGGGFAASGTPMIIGSRVRAAAIIQIRELACKNHKAAHWPHNMKAYRDGAAEEMMVALRALNEISGSYDVKLKEAAARAKSANLKAAALLMRAGANVPLEDI